ncbi:MAG: S-methyl-5'-thioadenosine phosphorylase, partial [Nanoarchaeota archaeon]|nr:S-methyl-5'-thioadenosine phosphorylase [Nanoarchaeota archaeon]
MVKVGIIGGSGVYDSEILEDIKEVKVHTPFGATSDSLTIGRMQGTDIVFLPRHGQGHKINPTNVPYRANIWAMKELGVTHILAPSAVGSLKEEIKPGDIVFSNQFIDRTLHRRSTFYEGSQVCHISVAEPCCNSLRKLLIESANSLGFPFHEKGTCVVIEGPRFSTRAESNVFKSWNADIIGMTMAPEVVLAREAQICYQTIATVTDYDVWKT